MDSKARGHIRKMIQEAFGDDGFFEFDEFKEFLSSIGQVGHEDDILSIIEKSYTDKVKNDIEEYAIFHDTDIDIASVDNKDILTYFLDWNGINIDQDDIVKFMKKV